MNKWEVVTAAGKGLPGINRVFIMGNVGKEPELVLLQSGKHMLKFSVATNEFINKGGRELRNVQWHKVLVHDPLANKIAKLVEKGSRVAIYGRLVHNEYTTSEGQKLEETEIEVEQMQVSPQTATGPKPPNVKEVKEEIMALTAKIQEMTKKKEDQSVAEFPSSDELTPEPEMEMTLEELDAIMDEKGYVNEEQVKQAATNSGAKPRSDPFF